jgi:DNA-binding winged helix-turn-helix (wHTH) protein
MIPKSGYRFSDKIMRRELSMIPKRGYLFSGKIMRRG